ncbi:MAG: hypothetical protein ABH881_01315 [bacterium]
MSHLLETIGLICFITGAILGVAFSIICGVQALRGKSKGDRERIEEISVYITFIFLMILGMGTFLFANISR